MSVPWPSEKEEVWRYSPIDDLDLDAYGPVPPGPAGAPPLGPAGQAFVEGMAADLAARSAMVVVRDGRPVAADLSRLPGDVTVAGLVGGDGPLPAAGGRGASRRSPVPCSPAATRWSG